MLRLTALFAFTLLPALAPAADRQTERFLLAMEANNKLAAHAVVDASTLVQDGRIQFWQMTVTYYLAGRSGRADGILTRHYGGHVAHRAGPDVLTLELRPNSVLLSLPLPDGSRAVPLMGGRGGDGKWSLSGSARFKGQGNDNRWSVSSVRRIQAGGSDLRD